MERITPGDWDVGDVLNRCDLRLWQFDLYLISNSRPWIGPIIGRDKTAGGGSRDERASDLLYAHSKLTGKLAVHFDFDARVIERLLELQVAQYRNLAKLHQKLFCIGSILLQ